MEKRKIGNLAVLFISSIPWAFLAMYGDKELHTALLYAPIVFVPALMGWLCRKATRLSPATVGNLLSCLISLLCAHLLTDWESWYFKPFGITGWVIALSLLAFMIQFLIGNFRKDMEPAVSLLYALCVAALVLIAVVFVLLTFSAVEIGAI